MNTDRISQLDEVWRVYCEWLDHCDGQIKAHRRQLTFAEWLHLQYEQARKEGR